MEEKELRYNWSADNPQETYFKTSSGSYICSTVFHTDIGHFIRISVSQIDDGKKYGLFLSLRVQENGEYTYLPSQCVATFSTKFHPDIALSVAENWFERWLRDLVQHSEIELSRFETDRSVTSPAGEIDNTSCAS